MNCTTGIWNFFSWKNWKWNHWIFSDFYFQKYRKIWKSINARNKTPIQTLKVHIQAKNHKMLKWLPQRLRFCNLIAKRFFSSEITYSGMLPTTTNLKPIISEILPHKANIYIYIKLFKNNKEVFQRNSYKFFNNKNKSWKTTEFSVILWSTYH